MSKRRTELRLAGLVVAGVGLVMSAVAGLFLYVNLTTTPIHPAADEVRGTAQGEPAPEWAGAVERGRQIARAGVAGQNLPGLSVAVGVGGRVVWAEGFGWADLDTRAPVTPRTKFRIGTSSTLLTSAGVGVLLDGGRLALDDEIQSHVPAFPRKPWPVTLRHVMGHTGGIRPDEGDEEPIHMHCEDTTGALPRFADAPLLFEPGTRSRHSSYGWVLVSAAIESAADQPFDMFMRHRVFEPSGMEDTRADAVVGTSPDQATYYFPRFAADPHHGPQEPDQEDFSCFAGAGAFVSTPSDLVRFGNAIAGGALLAPATVQLLQTPQRLASGEETRHGLGWDVDTVTLGGTPTRVVGSEGRLRGGPVMSFLAVPDRGIVVAVTSNTSYAKTWTLAAALAEVFAESRRGERE